MATKIVCDWCGKDTGEARNYKRRYQVTDQKTTLSVFANLSDGTRMDLCGTCTNNAIVAVGRSLIEVRG